MGAEVKERHVLSVYFKDRLVSTVELEDFNKATITFGRSRENDIVINSPIVSVKHGVIEKDGEEYIIRDLDSTNGLLLNGILHKELVLSNGDSIRIDDVNDPHSEGILLLYSVTGGDSEEKWVELQLAGAESVSIGRGEENGLLIRHSGVSKNHALITKRDDGCFIEDLKSTNGTYLNGKLLTSPEKLKLNDVILIVNTKIIFKGNRLQYNISSKGLRLEAIQVSRTIREKGKGLFGGKREKRLVDNINISIKPGELVALIGGSGAGKSTFMDCLNGFRRATEGKVLVNGDDFYANYEAYKSIMGYVPQQDIVYDNLTVVQMLKYAAELRMPEDTAEDERNRQVAKVVKSVELDGRENLLIKNLSGGQKKRASIAVELLAEPKLFFLDEPTSGLDPGMERNMMRLLKNLSNEGKTIVVVTHAMANLGLCDKIVFLGKGGKLCYFGDPGGALEFFGVKDFTDVFDMIGSEPEKWEKCFQNSNYYIYHKMLLSKQAQVREQQHSRQLGVWKQFKILTRRYLKLTLTDKQRFLVLLLQAPLIAILIGIVSRSDSFKIFENSKQVLFTLTCSAIWIGMLNSIQEICKERSILKRELMVNLRLLPYMLSKLVILGALSLVQSFLLVGIIRLFVRFPDKSFMGSLFLEVMLTTYLAALASTAMGLLISSIVTNNDRAMGLAPILLIPQILFSSVLFKLSGATKVISYFAVSRWTMGSFGISFDINKLPLKISVENPGFTIPQRELEDIFERSLKGLVTNWGVLVLFLVVCITAGILILSRSTKKQ